jgi:signal transduction histidine kinase
MGPAAAAVTPFLKENFHENIIIVARALEPYFPDITADWRTQVAQQFGFDARAIAALERITFGAGCQYFCHDDFDGFDENLAYFGARLAKLRIDTRAIRSALALFEQLCRPYLDSIFGEDDVDSRAAMEMISSAAFVAVTGAYFDERSKQTAALLEVLDVELKDGEVRAMLQQVLEITCRTFDAAAGAILLRDVDSDFLRVEATVGFPEEMRGEFSVKLGQGLAGAIVHTGEPEIVLDPSRDRRILSPMLRQKAKSLWGVPLKTEGRTIGVIIVGFSKPYDWLPTERDLMRAIADRSALAVDRARITQALREREARIAELSGHLLKAQEEERKRISRELHDETGQALMVIRLYLGMLDQHLTSRAAKGKVKETVQVVDNTVEGLRRIIGKLSPLVLQELGLFAAIRKEVKYLENKGVKTRVAIADEVGRLASDVETALYRIVQEALHNVAKHAQARNVNIQMTREAEVVRLVVEDDGVGIFPKANFRGNSFGLAGIKERVSMLGGDVRVVSLKGKGTRIEVTVPAPERAPLDAHEDAGPLIAMAAAPQRGGLHAKN